MKMLRKLLAKLSSFFDRHFLKNTHRKLDAMAATLDQSIARSSIDCAPASTETKEMEQHQDYNALIRLSSRPSNWYENLIIYDVGMNNGEDTEYYLEKGFKVIAIEANPLQCEQVSEKLHDFIKLDRLKILNLGVNDGRETEKDFYINTERSAWSSFNGDVAGRKGHKLKKISVRCSKISELIKQYGQPYYVKIDIEGSDADVVKDLMRSKLYPPYLSISGGGAFIDLLRFNGYNGFKYINQAEVSSIIPKSPPREGKYVDWKFALGSSGSFGEDTLGDWLSFEDIFVMISQYIDLKSNRVNPDQEGKKASWYDIHTRHQAFETKIALLSEKMTLPSYHFFPDTEGKRIADGGIRKHTNQEVKNIDGLVSVITVVKNNVATIERCLTSVKNQTYESIEHIIIDGGSNDGTLDILKKWEDQIDYFISEPDKGLYHAMNKGIQCAKGEYIAILNSDDWFEEGGLMRSIQAIKKSNADFSVGYANVIDADGKNIHTWKIGNYDERILVSGMSFCHQAVIARKHCYDLAGLYDTSFRISADYKWVKRMYLLGLKAIFVEHPIVNFSYTGLTVSARSSWKEECAHQLIEHFSDLTINESRLLIEFIYRDQKFKLSHFDIIRKLQYNKQFMLSFGLFLSQRIIEYEGRFIK